MGHRAWGVDARCCVNPILLYDNRFKDGPITATDTAPGYDPASIADERPYKLWMGNSGGTKEIIIDCGTEKPANVLGLKYHNLATVGANISISTSPDGSSWTTRLASVPATSDYATLLTFTETQARYWKLVCENCTDAPFIGHAVLGQALTFPYPPDMPYVPYHQRTVARTSFTDDNANPIEAIIDHKRIEIDAQFSNNSRDFVFGAAGTGWGAFLYGGANWGSGPTFQDFIEKHGSDLRWFFWAWDLENFPRHVFFVKLKDDSEYSTPLSMLRFVDTITLAMEGVLEW